MLGDMTDVPTQEPAPLVHVDEDWQSALCVVAHPDDMEFGGAAAVARWTGQGKRVVYCMVTSGEAGIDGMHPEEARSVREAEQVESARIVGVDEVEFLRLPDGILEYGVPLRRAIAAVVRRHRPDVVRAHSAYIDGLGWHDFDPAEFLQTMSRATGSRLGVRRGAPFEVFSMGWGD